MKRLALPVLVAVLVAAPASEARLVEEVAASGQVTATLSYDKRKDTYRDFRVRVERAGQILVDQALPEGCRKCFARPAFSAGGDKSIVVRDLDSDGEPEVIAAVYTNGAHCCTISTLFGFQADAGDYRRVRRNWRDAAYQLRDLGRDGIVEFHSRDARFAYAFSSYAESFLPVQVFRYRAGGLVDVTRRFPRVIRRDARDALRLYRRYRDDRTVNPRGFLAGWVADKYRLGQRRRANRALRSALRRGDLGKTAPFQVGPAGRKYIRQLKRFLRRLGY